MWKYTVELYRPQMKIWRMFIACWTLKATNKRSVYVLFIFHCNNFYNDRNRYWVISIYSLLLYIFVKLVCNSFLAKALYWPIVLVEQGVSLLALIHEVLNEEIYRETKF
jgi:hypothetical protein